MEGNHHIKKYIEYHNKYTDKYGENTLVLMQAGSHFNIFAIINEKDNGQIIENNQKNKKTNSEIEKFEEKEKTKETTSSN